MLMHWRERFTGRPLAVLATVAVAGVVLADRVACLPGMGLVFGALCLASGWMAARRAHGGWVLLLAGCLFAFLHTVGLSRTRFHPVRVALERYEMALPVEVVGRVEQALRSDLPGDEPGEAMFLAREIRCSQTGETWRGPTTLKLLPGKDTVLPTGEYRIEGRLRLPEAPDNPGQFDARDYQLRLGLVAELWATRTECLRADRWNLEAAMMDAAERCRAWMREVLSTDLVDRPKERGIILAMALGTMDEGAKELEKPFRESGTLHIFAVSGLHVAIVAMILWTFLRLLALRRGVQVVVLIAALFTYAFITGLRPSAVRSALMATVLLAGMGLQRRTDLLNSLGAAALLLIWWDTQQVFAPGFQLSFGVLATIGIFGDWLTKRLRHWIDPDPFLPKPLLNTWQKYLWSFRREFAGLFTVSTAAMIGSLPLIFAHFHMVTPISLVANAVLVPVSFLVLGTAILTVLCGLFHVTPLVVLFSNANLFFASFAMQSAQFFADVPGGNFHLPHAASVFRPEAELTVLRLPGGAAAQHLRVGGYHWLLDTGADEHFAYRVLPYLRHSGVDELDGVILSHGDYEHIGATRRTLEEFSHPPVWVPGEWSGGTRGRSSFRALEGVGVSVSPLVQGATLMVGTMEGAAVQATVLHPLPEVRTRRSDDRSLVVRFDLGGHRVLWCNDAGFLAEKAMLESLPAEALRCDVLIRNQHASDYSLIPDFLDAVRPRVVVSSNDTFPPEQKLPVRMREECGKRGIVLLDQRETGAVTLRFWREYFEVSSMREPAEPLPERFEASPRG